MRKILLNPADFELFDNDITGTEFEFFQRHKDVFKQMFVDQGKEFWVRFVLTFRRFSMECGVIKEYPKEGKQYEQYIDQAFIKIHESFVEVRNNKAVRFLLDIVVVAQNRTPDPCNPKSTTNNPFFMKNTRDAYRNLFGDPKDTHSYVKVFALLPLYCKFGGSICKCLRRWRDAPELTEGEEYWTVPAEDDKTLGASNDTSKDSPSQDACFQLYLREKLEGCPEGPLFIDDRWPPKHNPKVNFSANPLYEPGFPLTADWRNELSFEDFKTFYYWCAKNVCCVVDEKGDGFAQAKQAAAAAGGGKKKKKKKGKPAASPSAATAATAKPSPTPPSIPDIRDLDLSSEMKEMIRQSEEDAAIERAKNDGFAFANPFTGDIATPASKERTTKQQTTKEESSKKEMPKKETPKKNAPRKEAPKKVTKYEGSKKESDKTENPLEYDSITGPDGEPHFQLSFDKNGDRIPFLSFGDIQKEANETSAAEGGAVAVGKFEFGGPKKEGAPRFSKLEAAEKELDSELANPKRYMKSIKKKDYTINISMETKVQKAKPMPKLIIDREALARELTGDGRDPRRPKSLVASDVMDALDVEHISQLGFYVHTLITAGANLSKKKMAKLLAAIDDLLNCRTSPADFNSLMIRDYVGGPETQAEDFWKTNLLLLQQAILCRDIDIPSLRPPAIVNMAVSVIEKKESAPGFMPLERARELRNFLRTLILYTESKFGVARKLKVMATVQAFVDALIDGPACMKAIAAAAEFTAPNSWGGMMQRLFPFFRYSLIVVEIHLDDIRSPSKALLEKEKTEEDCIADMCLTLLESFIFMCDKLGGEEGKKNMLMAIQALIDARMTCREFNSYITKIMNNRDLGSFAHVLEAGLPKLRMRMRDLSIRIEGLHPPSRWACPNWGFATDLMVINRPPPMENEQLSQVFKIMGVILSKADKHPKEANVKALLNTLVTTNITPEKFAQNLHLLMPALEFPPAYFISVLRPALVQFRECVKRGDIDLKLETTGIKGKQTLALKSPQETAKSKSEVTGDRKEEKDSTKKKTEKKEDSTQKKNGEKKVETASKKEERNASAKKKAETNSTTSEEKQKSAEKQTSESRKGKKDAETPQVDVREKKSLDGKAENGENRTETNMGEKVAEQGTVSPSKANKKKKKKNKDSGKAEATNEKLASNEEEKNENVTKKKEEKVQIAKAEKFEEAKSQSQSKKGTDKASMSDTKSKKQTDRTSESDTKSKKQTDRTSESDTKSKKQTDKASEIDTKSKRQTSASRDRMNSDVKPKQSVNKAGAISRQTSTSESDSPKKELAKKSESTGEVEKKDDKKKKGEIAYFIGDKPPSLDQNVRLYKSLPWAHVMDLPFPKESTNSMEDQVKFFINFITSNLEKCDKKEFPHIKKHAMKITQELADGTIPGELYFYHLLCMVYEHDEENLGRQMSLLPVLMECIDTAEKWLQEGKVSIPDVVPHRTDVDLYRAKYGEEPLRVYKEGEFRKIVMENSYDKSLVQFHQTKGKHFAYPELDNLPGVTEEAVDGAYNRLLLQTPGCVANEVELCAHYLSRLISQARECNKEEYLVNIIKKYVDDNEEDRYEPRDFLRDLDLGNIVPFGSHAHLIPFLINTQERLQNAVLENKLFIAEIHSEDMPEAKFRHAIKNGLPIPDDAQVWSHPRKPKPSPLKNIAPPPVIRPPCIGGKTKTDLQRCVDYLQSVIMYVEQAAKGSEENKWTKLFLRAKIQDLVDDTISAELFLHNLLRLCEGDGTHHPVYITFLKKTLGPLRKAMSSGKVSIPGVTPPRTDEQLYRAINNRSPPLPLKPDEFKKTLREPKGNDAPWECSEPNLNDLVGIGIKTVVKAKSLVKFTRDNISEHVKKTALYLASVYCKIQELNSDTAMEKLTDLIDGISDLTAFYSIMEMTKVLPPKTHEHYTSYLKTHLPMCRRIWIDGGIEMEGIKSPGTDDDLYQHHYGMTPFCHLENGEFRDFLKKFRSKDGVVTAMAGSHLSSRRRQARRAAEMLNKCITMATDDHIKNTITDLVQALVDDINHPEVLMRDLEINLKMKKDCLLPFVMVLQVSMPALRDALLGGKETIPGILPPRDETQLFDVEPDPEEEPGYLKDNHRGARLFPFKKRSANEDPDEKKAAPPPKLSSSKELVKAGLGELDKDGSVVKLQVFGHAGVLLNPVTRNSIMQWFTEKMNSYKCESDTDSDNPPESWMSELRTWLHKNINTKVSEQQYDRMYEMVSMALIEVARASLEQMTWLNGTERSTRMREMMHDVCRQRYNVPGNKLPGLMGKDGSLTYPKDIQHANKLIMREIDSMNEEDADVFAKYIRNPVMDDFKERPEYKEKEIHYKKYREKRDQHLSVLESQLGQFEGKESKKGGGVTPLHYDVEHIKLGELADGVVPGPTHLLIQSTRLAFEDVGPCRKADAAVSLECWHTSRDGKNILHFIDPGTEEGTVTILSPPDLNVVYLPSLKHTIPRKRKPEEYVPKKRLNAIESGAEALPTLEKAQHTSEKPPTQTPPTSDDAPPTSVIAAPSSVVAPPTLVEAPPTPIKMSEPAKHDATEQEESKSSQASGNTQENEKKGNGAATKKYIHRHPGAGLVDMIMNVEHNNRARKRDGKFQVPISPRSVLQFRYLSTMPVCATCGSQMSPTAYIVDAEGYLDKNPYHEPASIKANCESCHIIHAMLQRDNLFRIWDTIIFKKGELMDVLWEIVNEAERPDMFYIQQKINDIDDPEKLRLTPDQFPDSELRLARSMLFEGELDARIARYEGSSADTAFEYIIQNVTDFVCFSEMRLKQAMGNRKASGESDEMTQIVEYFTTHMDNIGKIFTRRAKTELRLAASEMSGMFWRYSVVHKSGEDFEARKHELLQLEVEQQILLDEIKQVLRPVGVFSKDLKRKVMIYQSPKRHMELSMTLSMNPLMEKVLKQQQQEMNKKLGAEIEDRWADVDDMYELMKMKLAAAKRAKQDDAELQKQLMLKQAEVLSKKYLEDKQPIIPSSHKASSEKVATPVEKSGSVAEKSGSVAEKSGSVAEKSGSVAEKSVSLAEKIVSLAEKSRSMAEKSGSLAEKSRSMAGKSGSTADKSGSASVKSRSEKQASSSTERAEATVKVDHSPKEGSEKSKTLRSCAKCDEQEPKPRAYKKCQKCKEERVKNARYYCGRECQAADWTARHKQEHKMKTLD